MRVDMLPNPCSSEEVQIYAKNIGSSFGQSACSYASGRKDYPQEVLELLTKRISTEANLLELGCGTGFATKQLYDQGFRKIIATDIDEQMLEQARVYCPGLYFQVADANHLPFQDHTYDVVAAFGCFHWFCSEKAIQEIKRVLKPEGVFLVINKEDTGSFRGMFRSFLEKMEDRPCSEGKEMYRPVEKLSSLGFSVERHSFHSTEVFTRAQLLAYVKSISLWTALPFNKQESSLPALEQFVDDLMHNECYERAIEVRCLVAKPTAWQEEF